MSSTGLETCVRLLSSMLASDTREVRVRSMSAQKTPKVKATPSKNVRGKFKMPKVTNKKTIQMAAPARRSNCQEGEPCQRQLKKNPPVNLVSESENSTSSSIRMPLNSTDAVKMTEAVSSFVTDQKQPVLQQAEPDIVSAPGQQPPGATMYNTRLPSSTPNITPIDFKDGDLELMDPDQRILQLAQIIQRSRMTDQQNAHLSINPGSALSDNRQKAPFQSEKDVDALTEPQRVYDHQKTLLTSSGRNLVPPDLTTAQMAQYWSLLTQHNPERFQNLSAELQKMTPTAVNRPATEAGYHPKEAIHPPQYVYPTRESVYHPTDSVYHAQNVYPTNDGVYLAKDSTYSTQHAVYSPAVNNQIPNSTSMNPNLQNGQNVPGAMYANSLPVSNNRAIPTYQQRPMVVNHPTGNPLYQPATSGGFSYHGNQNIAPASASIYTTLQENLENGPRNFTHFSVANPSKNYDYSQKPPESPKKSTQSSSNGLKDSVKKVHFGIQTDEKFTMADTGSSAVHSEDEVPSRDIDDQKNLLKNAARSPLKTDVSEDGLKHSQDSLGSSGSQTKTISSQWQQTDPEHVLPPGEPPLNKPYNLVAVWRLLEELKRTTQDQKEASALVGRLETTFGQLDTQWTTDVNLALQPLRSQNAELRRRLRIAQQQFKQEMEKAAEASKPDITADLLHLGLQRRHLETQLATEHNDGERLRQEVALLQRQVDNLAREKKDLFTLMSHKESEYLKSQQERIQEAKDVRQQLELMREERRKMQMELAQARGNVEHLQTQENQIQQGGVHQLLRGLESGLRDMLKGLEESDSTPQQRAALERMLQDTSYLGSQAGAVASRSTYKPSTAVVNSQHQHRFPTETQQSLPVAQSYPRPSQTHVQPTRTPTKTETSTPTKTKPNKKSISPVSDMSLLSSDDPDNLEDQDSTLVEEVFPANMTVQSFLSLTEYFRRYPKSDLTPGVSSNINSIMPQSAVQIGVDPSVPVLPKRTKASSYGSDARLKSSNTSEIIPQQRDASNVSQLHTYTPDEPPQGHVYRGTQLDTSLSTIKDGESVSSGVTWSSLSSFNDEMFQQGLQNLDDHIAQLQESLKKSGHSDNW